MWTQDRIDKKLKYLREQKENPTGNYRKYLVRLYTCILEDSKIENRGWSNIKLSTLKAYVYEQEPDHMGTDMIIEWKKELKEMGYLRNQKVDGNWRTYIIKELDF